MTIWVTAAFSLLIAINIARAANFPDAHEKPPQGWSGPVFKLSQNYPARPPKSESYPWQGIDFKAEPERYIRAIYDFAREGNVETEWRGFDNPKRKWYHAPWMHYGDSGREFIHGMTRERNSRPKELAPTQACYTQNWAVGFYNAPGAFVIGQVWKDQNKPDATKALFPDGTVSIKLLFTSATESAVPYLKNAFNWQANIDPLTSACTLPDLSGTRKPASMKLLQIDLAVRDKNADSTTGWIKGTFVYDGSSSGATPWDRMIPVGVQWGNDPTLTPQQYNNGNRARESWINGNLKIPQHLGWLGRLNGPVDNPESSCLSCHGTAQDQTMSKMTPPLGSTDEQKMRWFRNIKAGEAFDSGDSRNPRSLDYSLQLASGIQNQRLATSQIKPEVANGDVIMALQGKGIVFPVTRDEGGEAKVSPPPERRAWLEMLIVFLIGFIAAIAIVWLYSRVRRAGTPASKTNATRINWSKVYKQTSTVINPSGATVVTQGTEDQCMEFYKSFGEWARHYSAVRMTVGTFFITVAFTILHLRWDKPDLLLAWSAFGVCLIGFLAFVYFSYVTFKRMSDQMRVVNAFLEANGETPTRASYESIWQFSGLPIALIFLLVFGVIDYCWYQGILTSKSTSEQGSEVKVPIVFQSGSSSAKLEVPITVKIEKLSRTIKAGDAKEEAKTKTN